MRASTSPCEQMGWHSPRGPSRSSTARGPAGKGRTRGSPSETISTSRSPASVRTSRRRSEMLSSRRSKRWTCMRSHDGIRGSIEDPPCSWRAGSSTERCGRSRQVSPWMRARGTSRRHGRSSWAPTGPSPTPSACRGTGTGRTGSMSLGDRQIALALLPDGTTDAAWESEDGTVTELSTAAAPAIMVPPPSPFSGRVGWTVATGTGGKLVGAGEGPESSPGETRSMEISSWTIGDRRFTVTGSHERRDGLTLTCVRLDADAGSEQTCRGPADAEGIATMYITELDGPLAVIAGVVPRDTATFVVRDASVGRVVATQQTVDGGEGFCRHGVPVRGARGTASGDR